MDDVRVIVDRENVRQLLGKVIARCKCPDIAAHILIGRV